MKYLYIFLALIVAIAPVFVFAQTTGINLNLQYPIFGDININTEQNPNAIVGWLYYFMVGISALAAFAMIVWGGIQWLTSGAIPSQASEARDKLKSAILGLLLIFASFLIIQIINPQLIILEQPTNPDALGDNPTLDALVGSGGAVGCGETPTVTLTARDSAAAPCTGTTGPFTCAPGIFDPSMIIEWTSPAGTVSCDTQSTQSPDLFFQSETVPSGTYTEAVCLTFPPTTITYTVSCIDSTGDSTGIANINVTIP